jgi:hypothetical protein
MGWSRPRGFFRLAAIGPRRPGTYQPGAPAPFLQNLGIAPSLYSKHLIRAAGGEARVR